MLDDAFDLECGMMAFRMIWSLLKETLCLNGHRHHHHHHRYHGIIIDIIIVVVIVLLVVQHAHVNSHCLSDHSQHVQSLTINRLAQRRRYRSFWAYRALPIVAS